MIYSCFDAASGLYDYYETDEQKPLNADLPVPQLGSPDNPIGIPAIRAGRPLPSGARKVGRGWHARGMVANCKSGGMAGLGETGFDVGTAMPLLLVAGVLLLAWKWK